MFALVGKLVARNAELEKRVDELLHGRNKSEGISSAQFSLLLHALQEETNQALAEASSKLKAQTVAPPATPAAQKPARQPSVRRPAPPNARRIDNPIAVPAHDRPCPSCGDARVCIGHDVTEVIELIPAEVVVRLDRREKLACERCDGELVRAPLGEYQINGVPLHSQGQLSTPLCTAMSALGRGTVARRRCRTTGVAGSEQSRLESFQLAGQQRFK